LLIAHAVRPAIMSLSNFDAISLSQLETEVCQFEGDKYFSEEAEQGYTNDDTQVCL
jgi:hypothetical protein